MTAAIKKWRAICIAVGVVLGKNGGSKMIAWSCGGVLAVAKTHSFAWWKHREGNNMGSKLRRTLFQFFLIKASGFT